MSHLGTTLALAFTMACSEPPPDVCGAIEDRLLAIERAASPEERALLTQMAALDLRFQTLWELPPGLDKPTLDREIQICVRRLSGRVADQILREPTIEGTIAWVEFMPTITRAHADLDDFLRILEPDSPTDPLVRDDDRRFFDEHGGPRPQRSIFRVIFAADVVSDGGQAGVDALDVALAHPLSGARDLAVEAADYLLSVGDAEVDAIFEVLRLHEFDPDPQVAAAIRRTMSLARGCER